MLTTRYIRDHLDEIKDSLQRRKSPYPIDRLESIDNEWRDVQTRLQALQADRNRKSLEIAKHAKSGSAEGLGDLAAQATAIKAEIGKLEEANLRLEKEIEALIWNVPNALDKSVPYGASDADNVELKKWGAVERKKVAGHEETLIGMGLLDVEQAAKVAGARFYYLKGDLALLEQALIRFGIDELVAKGYTLIAPPMMLKREYYRGVAPLGIFEEDLYKVADPKEAGSREGLEKMEEDLFLISTAEHPLAAMHAGQTFKGSDLPKRYVAISSSFRREAGSHGKYSKGIFRVHHFYKVEQFIFCRPEDSWKYFDELQANTEAIWQKLGMPYRVMALCTADTGAQSAKTNDIEVYMKAQDTYRELASCSNCLEWQSVRLDIKYDEKGSRNYVHTLNSTVIPTERALVAITENYLNDGGTITVPEALVPYMNGKRQIG
ncbi:MAG: serine--tRNA ligase [Candidatus Micrarchaeota archaeon]|nr:serine--tRNA ligase [Candidatus Micrarchaeota archaeon]